MSRGPSSPSSSSSASARIALPPPPPAGASRDEITAYLRKLPWADITRSLTLHAHTRLHRSSRAVAEELAQEAIMRCLDSAYSEWDPQTRPDVFDFLGHVVNGLAANHLKRQKRAGKHIQFTDGGGMSTDDELSATTAQRDDADKISPADQRLRREDEPEPEESALVRAPIGASPEALYARAEEGARATAALGLLGERIADDDVCVRLVALMRKGVDKPAELAKEIGVDVYEITKAKKRLAGHVSRVALDIDPKNAKGDA